MKRNQHSILLIEPPFYRLFSDKYSLDRYPLGLGYLAATIRKETPWRVTVYNADFSPCSERMRVSYLAGKGFDNYLNHLKDQNVPPWREVKSTIEHYEPNVVGISAKSQNFASARIVARLAKETDREILVVVGGPHPSMVGSAVLSCPDFDMSVKGEGERTVIELLDAIDRQKPFGAIAGIAYRSGGKIVENPPRAFITDLDSLPFPHKHASEMLKDYDRYPLRAFRYVLATRGCPYDCLYCGSRQIWGRNVRFRSPTSVTKEIRALQSRGLRSVHFADDNFGTTKRYIKELCEALIKHCPGLKWSCELHVRLVDEETIRLMKSAGCYMISVGVESGNNEILREMRKRATIEEALLACRIIKRQGLELEGSFIVGFPQEDENTLRDTARAMMKFPFDGLVYSVFTPYPGSEAFELCRQKGLIDDGYDVSLYNHQSPANCFCANISRERFRQLAHEIEKMVDRKNRANRIKRVFSRNTIWRLGEPDTVRNLGMRAILYLRSLPEGLVESPY